MIPTMTRRSFSLAAAGAFAAQSPNSRIGVGLIGVGNIGTRHLERRLLPMQRDQGLLRVVAVSEIYDRAKLRAKEMIGIGDKDVHHDYHDLLARPDIDAVVIATPDHWHARMAIDAMEAGKDVYLEKPMSRTIPEAKAIAETVERTGRVLQVGSQWVSDAGYVKAKEIFEEGWIGDLVWLQSSYSSNHKNGVWQYYVDEEANPDTVDWKRFLGGSADQPFSGDRFFRWRKYWEFSGGIATDFFYHRLSPLLHVVGPQFPMRASGHGGIYFHKNRQVPDTYSTTIEYENFGCTVMGSSATRAPNAFHAPTFYGQMGTIQVLSGRVEVRGESLYEDEFRKLAGDASVTFEVDNKDQQTARTAHMLNFLECVKSRQKPALDARFGYQVMTAIKLGVDSYRMGRTMAFDPASETMLDEPPPRHPGYEGDGSNDPNAPASYQKRRAG